MKNTGVTSRARKNKVAFAENQAMVWVVIIISGCLKCHFLKLFKDASS